MMRGKGLVLGLAGAAVFSTLLVAQQQPIQGCNAALSCNQPRGFSTLTGNAGGTVFFGLGVRWGPGVEFGLANARTSAPAQEPTPNVDARTFRLRGVSLLPPEPTPTPVPRSAPRS